MYSIKQSFADCSKCELLDAPSCILESNVDDFSKVDVIFIAENPGNEEVNHDPPKPLVGRAGRIFRKYFNKLFKDNFNWLLTNCVLCLTLTEDGKTGNPDKDTIQRCKVNCFEVIKRCNPKLVVLMGTSSKDAFGIKGQITKITGEFFEWEGINVMTTIHPSSINRPGGKSKEPIFKDSLEKVAEFLGLTFDKKIDKKDNKMENGMTSKKGKYLYQLSDAKFYSEDYMLIDVQYLHKERKVLYIFKDKDNNKIYHKENDDFVCYKIDDINKAEKVVPYDELTQIKVPYHRIDTDLRNKINNDLLYESDVNIEIKHTQDYYMQNKGEPDISLNIMTVDIEVHTKGNKEFPKPEDSKYPIAMITNYEFDNDLYKVFVFDVNNENLNDKIINDYPDKNVEIYVYKNEKELMLDWVKEIKRDDIDVLTGWYVIPFDMNYIYNRLTKLGINTNMLSKFNETYFNLYSEYCHIPGLIVLDGIRLYKEFTFTKLESYSLDAVSRKEVEKGKIDSGSTFSDIFDNDINHAIHYNIVDVELLYDLDKKLMHVFLQNELRKICGCNFKQSMTPMGRLDSLLVKFLKEKGYGSKDANPEGKSSKFEGAYVHPPIVGCHDWIVDFDFTSLYPSIILTYNIGVNTFVGKLKDKSLGYELFYNKENLPEKIEVILDPLFEAKELVYKKDELLEWIGETNVINTISGCFYKQHEDNLSFYAEILEMLLGSRKKYKNQMFEAIDNKDKSLESLYDTRQQVYKILANALYGILGNNAFRFFNLDLARTITLSGQEAIKQSIIKGEEFVESIKNKSEADNNYSIIEKNQMFSENMDLKINNIITGDTDSIFAKFDDLLDKKKEEDKIIEDVITYCNMLQSFLNEKVLNKLVHERNVDLSKNRLELKNELVIKRGIFLSKKHYGIYVIQKEGSKIDKINDMGLDTKRSDYPSKTKRHLNELLELILKSEKISLKKINNFIKAKEKEFIDLTRNGQKEIARPVSFSKKLEEYKKITNGVEGMLNWNKLMYNIFDHGSRGYLFKLNGINIDKAPEEVQERFTQYFSKHGKKLNYIVIPETEEKLPEFFDPDVKSMVKFSWKDRYNLILKPIMNVDRGNLNF